MRVYNVSNDSIPDELKRWPHWVGWRRKRNAKKGMWDKVPINLKTGGGADVTDPATWGTFEEACAYASDHYLDGVGFVFTPGDPFCGVDLDDCIDSETGEVRLGADEVNLVEVMEAQERPHDISGLRVRLAARVALHNYLHLAQRAPRTTSARFRRLAGMVISTHTKRLIRGRQPYRPGQTIRVTLFELP